MSEPKLSLAALDTDALSLRMSVACGSSSTTITDGFYVEFSGAVRSAFQGQATPATSLNVNVSFVAVLSKQATAMMSYR